MNTIQKRSLHQLYSRPILFVGLLLLLAGAWCYTQMQTNLFPEVLFPRITVIADAGQQPVDRMMITVTKPLESAVKKVQGTTVVKHQPGQLRDRRLLQVGTGYLCFEDPAGEPYQ